MGTESVKWWFNGVGCLKVASAASGFLRESDKTDKWAATCYTGLSGTPPDYNKRDFPSKLECCCDMNGWRTAKCEMDCGGPPPPMYACSSFKTTDEQNQLGRPNEARETGITTVLHPIA